MKTNSWLASALMLISFCARGQVSRPLPASVPVIVESGLHHRVWQTLTVDEEGQTNVSAFTEVATGLNFLDPATGQYLPSQELFQIAADGSALAAHGQHRVRLDSDINSGGSVDLAMPGGQRLISNPMGLSFFDYSSGKNILLAEVTNCIGELVAPNMVVYASAFDTLKAALRYTYTKDGFEQDVILYENPGSPADYGLNPDTTLLEMYTEFNSPAAPQIATQLLPDETESSTLDFGPMRIGRGQAYFLNDTLEAADVSATWANMDGRAFLVESVPYQKVKPMLDKLALANGQAANRPTEGRKGLVASLRPREKTLKVASIKPGQIKSNPALAIDYLIKNSDQTNFTWLGDTTYYISGNVGLYGTNTIFEGGAVLKYTNNVSLTVNTPLTWQGSAYRPVVLTARDDASVGDSITPTNALSGYYATVALALDGNAANTNFVLQNLRVANAQTAIAISGKSGHAVIHAQLVTCQNGFSTTNADFSLRNALFDHVLTNFTGSSSTSRVEHLTVDTASWLNNNIGTNLYLTNCLLVAVTNTGSFSSNSVSSVSSASGVFQSVGQGFHYLNTTNSIYRNVGTTNINSTLAAQLKRLTTYPPVLLTSDFTVSTTLNPQAQRDTDTPDLGWHYDPLDYCWTGLNLTNSSTLTLTNCVAIGFYGSYGLYLRTSANLISEGTPINLNRMTPELLT